MVTKEHMLATGIVFDNIYLDKYMDLLFANKDQNKEKGVTHAHHIIPKYYFSNNNIPVDDSADNVINLKYSDHILSHYYLSQCSTSSYYVFCNVCAIKHLVGNNMSKIDSYSILESLLDLQELYEDYASSRKGNVDLTGVNKGKIWVTNDIESHRVYPEELDAYLQSGYRLGSGCTTNKGLMFIHKGTNTKMIHPKDLATYIADGYVAGRPECSAETIERMRRKRLGGPGTTTGRVGINDGEHTKYVQAEVLSEYLSKGWVTGILNAHEGPSWTSEERANMSKRISESVWVHKDTKNRRINQCELDVYLSQGYVRGRYTSDKSMFANRPCRWMTKDGLVVRVRVEEVDAYLQNGYRFGRPRTGRKK